MILAPFDPTPLSRTLASHKELLWPFSVVPIYDLLSLTGSIYWSLEVYYQAKSDSSSAKTGLKY